MLDKDACFRYEPEIKKTTKANSFIASGRVIYIVKKDNTGKAIKIYAAYDKDTKILLLAHWDKDILVRFVQRQDLSSLGGNIQLSLF